MMLVTDLECGWLEKGIALTIINNKTAVVFGFRIGMNDLRQSGHKRVHLLQPFVR